MLLLVLILVLIAFGLLVVAVLSGSVLWAWVSVGVSVAAALVLLIDWLQRRSAVKAGSENAPSALPPPPAHPRPYVDLEPATEVIPVVPPPAPGAQLADENAAAPTVALPAVTPSSSADRPSTANARVVSNSPGSSPSVTEGGQSHAAATARAEDAGSSTNNGSEKPTSAGDDTVGEKSGESAAEAASTTTASESTSSDAQPETVTANEAEHAPSDRLAAAAQQPAAAQNVPAADGQQQPVGASASLPPLGPDGAPPEEPRDPEAAAVVANLEDEVLVIDELPRYHLFGCRSLLGRPVIPLPAREAVELGFTPCGWCTPDRALSARHHAGAR